MKKKFKLLLLSITVNSVIFCNAQNAGNALNFDGTDAYCSSILPTVFNSISTNDFTIECWVKVEGSSLTKRVFFAQKDASNFCSILINSTNVPYFFLGDNGLSYSVNTQMNLLPNVWTHLAFAWDASTNTIASYIDGIQVNGISGGGSSLGVDNVMTIGGRTDGQQVFKGSIDELRIWNDIRTPCEIYAGLNTNFTVAQPNLVAAYSFDQGVASGINSGVTTLNGLNNTYNATLNNFTLSGSSSNWVTSGALISQTNNNSETRINTDIVTACDSYTWSDGNTYASSNNSASYTNTTNGCECINNLNLTVNYSSSFTDVITACESYTWIDNVTYTSSNNSATYLLSNAIGCDSIVTLDLTIHPVVEGTDVISACGSYTWIDGNTYTSSNNTATHTLVGGNANGCDSIVTLNLTINTVDVSVTDNSPTLIATNASATSYQWINCATFTEIIGETNATYEASIIGNYAVIITENGCSDTSNCIIVNNVSLDNLKGEELIKISPNPTSGEITLYFPNQEPTTIEIYNSLGSLVNELTTSNKENKLIIQGESGVYLLKITNKNYTEILRVVKQ